MMSGIRNKNTAPEILLRRGLHGRGFRFRLHVNGLPGKPDIVFPKYRAVLFAHGCFWHQHDCHLFKWPKSREEFWRDKIRQNRVRDIALVEALRASGWRIGIVWECALKGRTRLPLAEVLDRCEAWLCSNDTALEIAGNEVRLPV
ncbi:very short patch repair endonuclease [Sphingomonas sp. LY54]|uniref:very short patch repair endonuclease n=1 Tax=Sphingomonas sp. LY54 TaxID=3095343 RepID=UPI002D768748|nr:very short patch repair endonuclease [Sphingomonas sp. LY54]WRP30181.1 very short patch repair endonuclease [Sphingomonas sp. LY54]